MNKTRLTKYCSYFLLILFLVTLPFMSSDPYLLHIAIMVGISVILVTSLRLTIIPGLWNLAPVAFYGIGSYAVYLLMAKLALSFWHALVAAGIVAGLMAMGLGYVTIRTKGMYFLLLTIAFVEVLRLTITEIPFLGGYMSLKVPRIDPIVIPHILKIEFASKVPFYYLIFTLAVVTVIVLYRIDKSRIGVILESIADSEPLAQSVGVNVTGYKVLAFCIGSFFSGLAGGFYAVYAGVISPQGITLWTSMMLFIAVIVGGMGSIWGSVVGAILLTAMPELFRGAVYYEPLLSAFVVILVLFFLPGGLITLPGMFRKRLITPLHDRYKNRT